MRAHSHTTDESSLGNKAPDLNHSAIKFYSLTVFLFRCSQDPKFDGKDSFASFTSPPLRLGNTAVIIAFHRNFPAGLVPGRAIKADKREPIALTSVTRAKDGKIIAFGENIFKD